MRLARAIRKRTQLDQAIEKIKETLGPDVVRLRYNLGEDWTGDSAIFFHIVISDEASRRDRLLTSTQQIQETIVRQLEPLEEWDVLPYFSYRNQSEFAALQDKAWV